MADTNKSVKGLDFFLPLSSPDGEGSAGSKPAELIGVSIELLGPAAVLGCQLESMARVAAHATVWVEAGGVDGVEMVVGTVAWRTWAWFVVHFLRMLVTWESW